MRSRVGISQIVLNGILFIAAVLCILPFVLLFMSSITEENTIIREGYSLFPSKLSLSAYHYLKDNAFAMVRAGGISVFVTVTRQALFPLPGVEVCHTSPGTDAGRRRRACRLSFGQSHLI